MLKSIVFLFNTVIFTYILRIKSDYLWFISGYILNLYMIPADIVHIMFWEAAEAVYGQNNIWLIPLSPMFPELNVRYRQTPLWIILFDEHSLVPNSFLIVVPLFSEDRPKLFV